MSHLVTCSECNKQLQVPDELLGRKVQCPECQHTFLARGTETEVIISSPKTSPNLPVPTNKGAAWETKMGREDDEDDDYAVKRRRRQNDDDADDDDYERPSRRRSSRRSRYRSNNHAPHRGGMILAFGIIALVSGMGIVFGPIAWIMGGNDLREISEGRMDPEGEGMTQTGRILGMIATILSIAGIVIALGFVGIYFFACCFCLAAGNNPNNVNNPNFNRPR